MLASLRHLRRLARAATNDRTVHMTPVLAFSSTIPKRFKTAVAEHAEWFKFMNDCQGRDRVRARDFQRAHARMLAAEQIRAALKAGTDNARCRDARATSRRSPVQPAHGFRSGPHQRPARRSDQRDLTRTTFPSGDPSTMTIRQQLRSDDARLRVRLMNLIQVIVFDEPNCWRSSSATSGWSWRSSAGNVWLRNSKSSTSRLADRRNFPC